MKRILVKNISLFVVLSICFVFLDSIMTPPLEMVDIYKSIINALIPTVLISIIELRNELK